MNIDRIRAIYTNQRTMLNIAIANNDQQNITVYRGRLIRTLSRLLNQVNYPLLTPMEQMSFRTELSNEIMNHRTQLDYRIDHEKRSNNHFSITNEVVLKIRRTANSISRIRNSNTTTERMQATLDTVGNTISTTFSISKYALRPIGFVAQRVGGGAAYLTGYAVGIPASIIGNVFGSVINPDREWTFTISERFGGVLRTTAENIIGRINDVVIRL